MVVVDTIVMTEHVNCYKKLQVIVITMANRMKIRVNAYFVDTHNENHFCMIKGCITKGDKCTNTYSSK